MHNWINTTSNATMSFAGFSLSLSSDMYFTINKYPLYLSNDFNNKVIFIDNYAIINLLIKWFFFVFHPFYVAVCLCIYVLGVLLVVFIHLRSRKQRFIEDMYVNQTHSVVMNYRKYVKEKAIRINTYFFFKCGSVGSG